MRKVLICASTVSHINNFHLPYLKYFKERGFEVHVAANGNEAPLYADYFHNIKMEKSIFSIDNLLAVRELRSLLKNGGFDALLLNTALAGAVGRLALLLSGKNNVKVIYTVHGYLFWKGCGLTKRLVYYLPEYFLRGLTDCIITMNDEDTATAKRLVKRTGTVEKVPGMGVDSSRFAPSSLEEKTKARTELSIPQRAFVLVYAAEFSGRKNHSELISAMSLIVKGIPDALLLLCGTGVTQDNIKRKVDRLELNEYVRFLGWQSHIEEIYKACDMAVSSSVSEGLPFNIVEAQFCAMPVVASDIRGHRDLIENGVTGWLYKPGDAVGLAKTVIGICLCRDKAIKQEQNASMGAARFSLRPAFEANTAIYEKVIDI